MWRRIAVVMALSLAWETAGHSRGQEVETTSLLSQQKWVRFDVILGRTTATHLRGGQGRRSREAADESVQERLTIIGGAKQPSVRFERNSPARLVTIEMTNRTTLQMKSIPHDGDPAVPLVRFQQTPGQPLLLLIEDEDRRQEYHAQSLWHLLLREPDACQDHLLPLLALMRNDWQLQETAAEIERALFQAASREPRVTRNELQLLIMQLNEGTFSERQAADRRLRQLGVSILPYLNQLDAGQLTAEQRLRIRHIRAHLSTESPDSASRAAAWLVNDKMVWLDLLTHREPQKRQAAASHLTGIHPGKILFDPLAEETRRNEQIARLRGRMID